MIQISIVGVILFLLIMWFFDEWSNSVSDKSRKELAEQLEKMDEDDIYDTYDDSRYY
jgi:uncharacterized membrane protein YhiD involved in acid resistance